jgi:predicted nuclease of restriction endonuclease-like (RecB) superfamily
MRQFYYEYADSPELFELAKDVRWSTNITILHKVKLPDARKFYLQMASETMCSRDIIELQIKSEAYEREYLHNKKHNFHSTLPTNVAARADNILKASYFLEVSKPFVGSQSLLEKQIENEMVSRIKEVIMMLGKGFAFIGNQYRIAAEENEYFIDLLFFNRIIRSLFAVELKAKKFKAEHAGKMNLYLGLLDDYVKQPDENSSIGLILCTDRNSVEADYALRDVNKPMGIAEIKLSKILPKELVGKLPDPKELEIEIRHELEGIEEVNEDD